MSNEEVIFMVFYHNEDQLFSIGKIVETGKILLTDLVNNVVYEDILLDYDSLKSTFSNFGYSVKQENLELYDSTDTYEMITLPFKCLFEKMDTNVGHNVDIYKTPTD
jgi:hypothetical protein